MCTHPGQQPTAERGNGGYLFKVGDNTGTMGSEGCKELMRGAAALAQGVKTQHKQVTEELKKRMGGQGWRRRQEKLCCQQNQMAHRQLGKIQLKCGVKTGFEVGQGA